MKIWLRAGMRLRWQQLLPSASFVFLLFLSLLNKIHICRVHNFPVPQRPNEESNVALIRVGMLGRSPQCPSVAICFDTLKLYLWLRCRNGQLSVQAMARILCDLHNVSSNWVLLQIVNNWSWFLAYLSDVPPQSVFNCLWRVSRYTAPSEDSDRHSLRVWYITLACPQCLSTLQLWSEYCEILLCACERTDRTCNS